jgi:hypothetical protein
MPFGIIPDLAFGFAGIPTSLQNVLQAATAAIARAKEAVGIQASSGTKAASVKARRAAKKARPSQKKSSAKKVAANAPRVKAAKTSRPVKRAAKKRVAKKTAPTPVVQAATEAIAQ